MRAMTMVLVLGAACAPMTNGGRTPAPKAPERATVVEVLATPALVGETVHVTGHCVAHAVARGQASPAVSTTAWLLEDYGQAVWVSGNLPDTCSASAPPAEIVSIVAVVRQDTLPMLGGARGVVRRYLEAR